MNNILRFVKILNSQNVYFFFLNNIIIGYYLLPGFENYSIKKVHFSCFNMHLKTQKIGKYAK